MKDKSFELALDSKLLNQMPKIQELVDNVAGPVDKEVLVDNEVDKN